MGPHIGRQLRGRRARGRLLRLRVAPLLLRELLEHVLVVLWGHPEKNCENLFVFKNIIMNFQLLVQILWRRKCRDQATNRQRTVSVRCQAKTFGWLEGNDMTPGKGIVIRFARRSILPV